MRKGLTSFRSTMSGNQDAIYFHGSESGRKADALSTATSPLCFTLAQEYKTIVVSTVPAETGTSYTGVMLFGNVAPITDLAEATAAPEALCYGSRTQRDDM
ncbi:pyridoxamine 5'-phosphate oxidase family protein [Laceyella sacchari]|uniref:Pyridoxamine 5'-phosphate oxidase family protein n=1 Tax=Laceyella sacchari TaxID=37482 RepID=A0ABY5U279_LACSH|nr:pyridoxamine 5'-phosphate oxidase family protein [Laceyella sacchari]UWE03130.1 pyridoxamine 5'-phosphate oxidase family protein [Laceyella sacchari]